MARLLNEVDRLSEQLHADFPTFTVDDFKQFGPELKIVIDTLKMLHKDCMPHRELAAHNERMRLQIADLEELDHDIREFRVKAPKDQKLQRTMAAIGKHDFSYLF